MGAVVVSAVAAPPGAPYPKGVSLLEGWVPVLTQTVAIAALLVAIARPSRRWWIFAVPAAAIVGYALAVGMRHYITAEGWTTNSLPAGMSIWIALTGAAIVMLVAGWRKSTRRRKTASALAVPLCLLCFALALNTWVGYFPTVQLAWDQLTAGPLPDHTDAAGVAARQKSLDHHPPGAVVKVDIPNDASHFRHRQEIVYLPPAWFATVPPPALPTVMMIAGAFNTPADWLRAGNAIATVDDYAARHGGYSPVLVFVDSGGSFNNDTECVNGPRGNAADHLVDDVVPYMVSRFGVRPPGQGWGIVGFSMGGTCAVTLTVKHPDVFSVFVDIGGDIGPNVGSEEMTTDRLFGGDQQAWESYEPRAAMVKHGPYTGVSGWFSAIVEDTPHYRGPSLGGAVEPGPLCRIPDGADGQAWAANVLCEAARLFGIDAAVVVTVGDHDWYAAAEAFAASLPWLAGGLATPDSGPVMRPVVT
jgi:S-formylglutathione hydrolase FrmB